MRPSTYINGPRIELPMSREQRTVAAKRDKWSFKKWYVVYAPQYLNGVPIGEVPASEPQKLINRTIEVTLFDITRDLSHLPIKLKFQINRVESNRAYVRFKQLELSRDYVRSLIRRGTSKVTAVMDVETRDGWRLRITVLAVTAHRAKTSQKRAIRRAVVEAMKGYIAEADIATLIRDSAFGKLAAELFTAAKKIYPLRKTEVMKIKVLKVPPHEERAEVVAEVAAPTTVQG